MNWWRHLDFYAPLALLAIAFVLSLRRCLKQLRAERNERQIKAHRQIGHGLRYLARHGQLPDDVQ